MADKHKENMQCVASFHSKREPFLHMFWTRLYEAQLSFNHGLKPQLIIVLSNWTERSSSIFYSEMTDEELRRRYRNT